MFVTATSIRHVTLENGLLQLSTNAVSFKFCVFALLFVIVPLTSLIVVSMFLSTIPILFIVVSIFFFIT